MNKYALITGVVAIVLVLAIWALSTRMVTAPTSGVQACTAEAKVCPDGSSVGRTGPNCEFAACPSSTTTTTGVTPSVTAGVVYATGIHGTVMIGPTCPVQKSPPDPACADKPYVTTITARHTGSTAVVATAKTASSGAYKLSLPAGAYTLSVDAGSGTLPRCSSVEVLVPAAGFATGNITCDTGIR